MNFGEQPSHGLATVVAPDVGMKVGPDDLNAIEIGTIGRKKTQNNNLAAEVGKVVLHLLDAVNAVVVESDMEVSGSATSSG